MESMHGFERKRIIGKTNPRKHHTICTAFGNDGRGINGVCCDYRKDNQSISKIIFRKVEITEVVGGLMSVIIFFIFCAEIGV
jgi:hypothetical protein